MNAYDNLPDELLVEVCEKMNLKSLTNMVQTSSRMYDVCNEILLDKRKATILEYVLTNMIKQEFDRGIRINNKVIGFKTYDKFVKFQKEWINDFDSEKVSRFEWLMNEIIPNSGLMNKEYMISDQTSGFCFDVTGDTTFFNER